MLPSQALPNGAPLSTSAPARRSSGCWWSFASALRRKARGWSPAQKSFDSGLVLPSPSVPSALWHKLAAVHLDRLPDHVARE
jgi:hypothetical protein